MASKKPLHFLIIDDNELVAKLHANIIEKAGYQVTVANSGVEGLTYAAKIQPDCILCDLSMPDIDGITLFEKIRALKIKRPTFIIITFKLYEYDRRKALELGVDGYLTKPIDSENFVEDVLEIINDSMKVQFWGVRGTLPVPGKKTAIYGGNTSCVTLSFAKKNFFIFDSGTGIKELSNHLVKENKFPMSAKIFISHPHYDHINGLPFFVPLYIKGNEFEIFGADSGDMDIEKIMSNQMNSIYFPITMKEFAANISFHPLKEETFHIDSLTIQTLFLNHPGKCLGFRVQHKKKSFCYITDNELYLKNSPYYNEYEEQKLIEFIKGTNVLVIDSTYMDDEYNKKIGWGHSCISRVVDIAHQAKVKKLCLFHHDPDQLDKDIKAKHEFAKLLLKERESKTKCIAPREGDTLSF